MKPYFYKIKEKITGRYYVGCQYGKSSNPNNFWVTYFTSNKYVRNQPKDSFEIVYVKERSDARVYERRYLQKCYKFLGRDKFCSILINRNIAPGILNTPESILKGNIKRKISNSIAARKRVENGTHNFILNPRIPDEHERARSSERMKGNKFGKLIVRDEEYRKKQATNSRGNKNVRGKKWWNNGNKRKRSKECPGEEWKEGFQFNR